MADLVDLSPLISALSELRGAAFDPAVVPVVEVAISGGVREVAASGDPEVVDALRQSLAGCLMGRWGRALEDHDEDRFDRFTEYLDHLRSSSELDTDALLDSYGGKPRAVLELVRDAGEEGLLQQAAQVELDLPKDYLSKVVARLADADLLLRWVEGRSRRLVITEAGRRAIHPRAIPITLVARGQEEDLPSFGELVAIADGPTVADAGDGRIVVMPYDRIGAVVGLEPDESPWWTKRVAAHAPAGLAAAVGLAPGLEPDFLLACHPQQPDIGGTSLSRRMARGYGLVFWVDPDQVSKQG